MREDAASLMLAGIHRALEGPAAQLVAAFSIRTGPSLGPLPLFQRQEALGACCRYRSSLTPNRLRVRH